MIKNPLPNYWTPILPNREVHWKLERITCPYERRWNLPCGTNRLKCKGCYMKQQSLRDNSVIHICDRCGFELTGDDHILYFNIMNREGGVMFKAELCEACASQIGKWLNNEDFFEDFYEDGDSR